MQASSTSVMVCTFIFMGLRFLSEHAECGAVQNFVFGHLVS